MECGTNQEEGQGWFEIKCDEYRPLDEPELKYSPHQQWISGHENKAGQTGFMEQEKRRKLRLKCAGEEQETS